MYHGTRVRVRGTGILLYIFAPWAVREIAPPPRGSRIDACPSPAGACRARGFAIVAACLAEGPSRARASACASRQCHRRLCHSAWCPLASDGGWHVSPFSARVGCTRFQLTSRVRLCADTAYVMPPSSARSKAGRTNGEKAPQVAAKRARTASAGPPLPQAQEVSHVACCLFCTLHAMHACFHSHAEAQGHRTY